jgi:hypothetical protein
MHFIGGPTVRPSRLTIRLIVRRLGRGETCRASNSQLMACAPQKRTWLERDKRASLTASTTAPGSYRVAVRTSGLLFLPMVCFAVALIALNPLVNLAP